MDFVARVAGGLGLTGANGSPRNYHSRTWDVDLFDLRVRAELSVDVAGSVSTLWALIHRDTLHGPNKSKFPADVHAPDVVAHGRNPLLGGTGVRGHGMARMVAQALSSPGRSPAAPPAVEPARAFKLYGAGGY